MDKYNELIKSLKDCINTPDENVRSVLKQTTQALETLQSVVGEKQKLLDAALNDMAKSSECKNCSNIDNCSIRRIERNLAYGACATWQWRGAKSEEKAS